VSLNMIVTTGILQSMKKVKNVNTKKYVHFPAFALVVLSISIKTIWLLSIPNQNTLMENDSVRYLRISENFWSVFFGGITDSDSFFITPGYPLFLSFFPIGNFKMMVFCQFLLLGVSQYVLFKLVLKHTSTKIAYFGLTLFLLESSTGLESFNLLTETLFNFVFVLFLYLLDIGMSKNLYLYASGFILGLALIVRPVGQILLIPLFLMVVFRTWRRQIAVVLLIAVAVSSTWIIRNQVVFGVPQLSGIQSLNLLQFEGAGAFSKQNSISLQEAQSAETALQIDEIGESASIQQVVDYRVDRGIKLIITNSVGFIELHLEGAGKILVGPGSANISKLTAHLGFSEVLTDGLKALIVMLRFIIIALVCTSTYFAFRRKLLIPIQFYSIVSWVLILISSGGANAYSRFRVPLIPLEILIICIGLSNPVQQVWYEKQIDKVKRVIGR